LVLIDDIGSAMSEFINKGGALVLGHDILVDELQAIHIILFF